MGKGYMLMTCLGTEGRCSSILTIQIHLTAFHPDWCVGYQSAGNILSIFGNSITCLVVSVFTTLVRNRRPLLVLYISRCIHYPICNPSP